MTILIDQDYLLELGVYSFIAILAYTKSIIIRTLDFKVNAIYILKVAGQEHQI